MELSFKNSEDFFYTGVHPSGYHLGRQRIVENQEAGSAPIYRAYIIPNNINEPLIKKKVSLMEFFMDIESFRKEHPVNENELMLNNDFPEKLVNKYGFLEGTSSYWQAFNSMQTHTKAEYIKFMEGEEIKGIPSIMLNDESFSDLYTKREELNLWIWLLRVNFVKPNTKNKKTFESAKWSMDEIWESRLISQSFPSKDPLSNKVTLEPTSLGSAYLFFRYSKNITETKRCANCEQLFVDASRSNNQKFCSAGCKVSAYRERQVNIYKNEIGAEFGLYNEADGKYKYLDVNFNDMRKQQIRRICQKHGGFITKIEKLRQDPGCPKCKLIND